jgi:hypothetical protein
MNKSISIKVKNKLVIKENQEDRKERLRYSKCTITKLVPDKKTIYNRKIKHKGDNNFYE